MAIGFINIEPIDHSNVYSNLEVVEIFQKLGWTVFFNNPNGFDDRISLEFSINLQ